MCRPGHCVGSVQYRKNRDVALTYEKLLAQQPPTTAAGNTHAARAFVELLNVQLNLRDSALTLSQQNYLYKLRAKWEKRATGADESWNQYGSRPGRRKSITERQRSTLDPTTFGDDDEKDPLLLSLERKYGRPRRTDDI